MDRSVKDNKRLFQVPKTAKMRTIGILTGISHQSGIDYYSQINNRIQARLPFEYAGHSSKCIMYSVDLEEYCEYCALNRYDLVNNLLIEGISTLYKANCDFVVIASNTGHMIYNRILNNHPFWLQKCPILHIGDCIAQQCKRLNIDKIGLLGTKYTMQGSYMSDQLSKHSIEVIMPENESDHDKINDIIEKELDHTKFLPKSRDFMLNIMKNEFIPKGCKGCILGCTEIGLLIQQKHVPKSWQNFFVIDSAQVHIDAAIDVQLGIKNVSDFQPNLKISCKL